MAATGVFRPIADYRDMIQMLHRDLTTRVGELVFTSEMIASAYAALISSLAITTAIFERNTSGIGQAVEMPLYDAMLQAVGVLAMIRPPFRAITKSIFSGFDHQYQCLDGRWVHIVATVPRHAEAFLNAVNRRDLIEKDANGFYPKDAHKLKRSINSCALGVQYVRKGKNRRWILRITDARYRVPVSVHPDHTKGALPCPSAKL